MAEARSAVTEPRVTDLEEGKDATRDFMWAWRTAILRRFFRTRNMIRNGMWPTSLWNLGVTTSLFSVLLIGEWKWAQPINSKLWALAKLLRIDERIPYPLRVVIISGAGGIAFFIILMYKRRWLLRVLLSYRGWMYEEPKKMSWKTRLWGLLVRVVSGYKPSLYSCQKSLPFLPVPDLNDTLNKFMLSIEPLYGKDSDEYQNFESLSKEFKSGLGLKLQRTLVLKSWWAQNWCTDWWEKYIYLMGRTPLPINSNYYVLDHGYWKPTHRQVSRAANNIWYLMKVKRSIDREQLPPLVIRNTIPVCMSQYEKLFGSTRIPGEDFDTLSTSGKSKYIMIMRKGIYYKLDVYDQDGKPVLPQNLEKQLQWIVDDAELKGDDYTEEMKSLAAFTGLERTEWARIRTQFFRDGLNKESLDTIEKALFHVVLDTSSFDTWTDRGKYMLHGNGKSIWFDKSFNVVVFEDGKMGINAEHSWGDAPVVGHMTEHGLTEEMKYLTVSEYLKEENLQPRIYTEDGYVVPLTEVTQGALSNPERLIWESSPKLCSHIASAVEFNVKNNNDLELIICDNHQYGKGFIKTCKVSPDAFFQHALHLAYFKDAGKFALTYEASMTRLYLHGRTETVRSLTNSAAAFVRAMGDANCSNEKRIELLRKSCANHTVLYKDAMNGKGIDRHLFGLYVVCKGLGHESEFLKSALMMPWTLSTSQQPQQQMQDSPNCHEERFRDLLSPGGGFGPVSDKGYGVSYMMAGDYRIFFHVSSKTSCSLTDSKRFVSHICESLTAMRNLFSVQKNIDLKNDATLSGVQEANGTLK